VDRLGGRPARLEARSHSRARLDRSSGLDLLRTGARGLVQAERPLRDGGVWENLGLVELFRRGCSTIYCISAAGDGADSFSTLGNGLAIAREELGVHVDIELEPLRSPAQAKSSSRRLNRGRKPDEPAGYAPQAYALGTFTYPMDRDAHGQRTPDAPIRHLLVMEANLTRDVPWDVQAYAESDPKFPNTSTAAQLFDHRRFEAYRALGTHQASLGVAALHAQVDLEQRGLA
jgi:hypothetical protein